MKLRTTFLSVLAVVAILLASTAFAGVALYKQSVVDDHRDALAERSNAMAVSLNSEVESKTRTVDLWTRNGDLRATDRESRRAALRSFVNETAFRGASVVDANGTMTAIVAENLSAERREQLVGSDFGHRTYVRRALDGETYVSSPVSAESGNDIVTMSAPIRRDGRVVATLNAAFHLSDEQFFSSVHRTNAPDVGVRVTAANETLYASEWRMQDDAIVANSSLSATEWTVSVAESPNEIRQHTRSLTLLQAGVFLFVLVVLSVFGGWFYRRTIRQLGNLQDGLDALESGEYAVSVDLGNSREWREIQSKLDAVGRSLERRESQIQVLNRVLRHNLRNSMVVIEGSVSEIESRSDDSVVTQETERIHRSVDGLLKLADNARVVEQSLQDELLGGVPTAVADVVNGITARLREEHPEVTIETDVPDGAVVEAGDALPILLDELCRNAIQHNPAPESDRVVSMTVELVDDRVEVTVADNGPGLPEFERELLTGGVTETPTRHGQGLGLWLVQWLVERLDGTISVTASDADGTVVTVSLPERTDE